MGAKQMKKIKNKFVFGDLSHAEIDDCADELIAVVEIDVPTIEYLMRHQIAAVENGTDFGAIRHAMRVHDVLESWRDDLVNAWPYRKRKAHEQFVANKRKAERIENDRRAFDRCKDNAGFLGAIAHPINADYNVECYESKPAGIDVDGLPFAVVCSLHGTVIGYNSRIFAIDGMKNITKHCEQCLDLMADSTS